MTEQQLDAQGEAHEALSSAVADFGQRVLSDPRMIRSRMSDLLPDLPRERDLLVTAAEADVAGELTQHVREQRLDPDTAVQLVSRSLVDRKSIDAASSTWVTSEYAQALGYRVRSDTALPVPPPPPSAFGSSPEPTVTSYAPYGSPNLQTAPPAPDPTAYPGYSPTQAPAGGGAYAAPPPRVGDGAYAPPPPRVGDGAYAAPPPRAGDGAFVVPPPSPGGGAYAAPPPPVGGRGYAPTQGPGVGQAPAAGPPPGPPPWVPPASGAKRRNRWPIIAVVALAVVGLIAGLLVWAPWHKVPVAPAAVHVKSPTATSVLVSWPASSGGATIDKYLILRDGTQVGSVPASQTSYLDNGLAPGTTHRYKIIAVSGTQNSQPAASAPVTTITPSPTGLTVGTATWTSVQFHWSPPPNSPAPDSYQIFINGAPGVTIPGGVTSFNDMGLQLATTYKYQVTAVWGGHQSSRSPVLSVTTMAAPLQGAVPLRFKTISTPGGGASLKAGQTWNDSWTFTPSCTATQCTLKTDAEFAPPGFAAQPFTVTLTGGGTVYAGTTNASITKCGSVNVHDTVTVRITANSGAVDNGAWNSWGGTMVLSSPYVSAGSEYCPAQAWNFALTGSSS